MIVAVAITLIGFCVAIGFRPTSLYPLIRANGRIIRFSVLNVCLASSMWGALIGVTSNTSCTSGAATVSDPKACSLIDAEIGAGGIADAVWFLGFDGNEALAWAGVDASAEEDGAGSGGGASSSIDASFLLDTVGGSDRMGLADITASVSNRGWSGCEIDSNLFSRMDCQYPYDPFGLTFSALVPVALGPDAGGIYIHFAANASSGGYYSSGGGMVSIKLFEADGVTGVAFTPEPSTLAMFSLALILLYFRPALLYAGKGDNEKNTDRERR